MKEGEEQEQEQGTPSVAFVPLEKEGKLSQWELEEHEEWEAQLVLVPLEVGGDWEAQQEESQSEAFSLEIGRGLNLREQNHHGVGGLLALWPQPFGASQVFPTQ